MSNRTYFPGIFHSVGSCGIFLLQCSLYCALSETLHEILRVISIQVKLVMIAALKIC